MNVKKGDLAIIVAADSPNAGKLVEVLNFYGDFDPYKDLWEVKSLGTPLITISKRRLMICYTKDSHLRPIQGLPKEDSVKDKKDEPIFRV